ncbi:MULTISPECIES: SMR family transporter [unclassified Helicobacter]|uniref:SMR family transporter n=1 Tax=unclassified Helicobacter TaxID=2593540 RepID=UPI000DCEA390|nr:MULTISPECIES: SMR family transporter [unclassified Helicobacter]MCI2236001.1 SMR family transporter [Helicobacter sp. CaF467b]MCI7047060.1 SMR family transporter [Helicobacter sp.]MDY4426048.1 SMR family transporter [Helicobacter sp.]RAX53547.1 ligand-binding protein SH3 [Helicobacter sp. 11-8110]
MFSVYFIYVILAAILDIVANLALNKSEGFRKLKWGLFSIALVWLAFYLLALSVEGGMSLVIAYTLWGCIGIFGTTLGGWYFFNQRLKPIGWIGIFIIVIAVIVLKTA